MLRKSKSDFSVKTWAQNATLFVGGLLLVLAFGEWLFPKFLNKIPFHLYGGVDSRLRILAQYSKQSLIPQNYIAILGDSNSVGVGDLYTDLGKNFYNWYPDYSPAHFIYKKTRIDTVSFGLAGAGSFNGIWSAPITQYKFLNSISRFKLSPPETILVLFYEGNDIGNNLQFIRENY